MKLLCASRCPDLGEERRANAIALSILAAGILALPPSAQASSLWSDASHRELQGSGAKPWVQPQRFRAVRVDRASLTALLRRATAERPEQVLAPALILELPIPDGRFARFRIIESPVMAPPLAAKFPGIKTYRGQGIDDPNATLRLDVTPAGVHAQVLSPAGAVYIDPFLQGDPDLLVSYYKRDYRKEADDFVCHVQVQSGSSRPTTACPLASGATLHTYRLACAGTGEYTQFHGGTVDAGMAAIVTTVNRVDGIYEQDLAVRLTLVADNNLLVYTNGATDPYTNDNNKTMLGENQTNVDAVIGAANYDIGHVFATCAGGRGWLPSVCVSGYKAGGATGRSSPVGDPFDVDYVAHEMGHQFGANHTFNGAGCSSRNGPTAYEPGSGSTIMGYAGVCSGDNLQPHSDPCFHFASHEEIMAYTTSGYGSSCQSNTSTGNNPPNVGPLTNCTIPCSTPFMLTASASDPDGDPLTYCWEEADLGPSTSLTNEDNGSSPLFRSFNPTTNAFRIFPSLTNILNNTTSIVERLPTTTRTLNFKVTVRDNHSGGGGVNSTSVTLSVTSDAGPFQVTSPNSTQTFAGVISVTWDVSGTAGSPVNCAAVDILLSTDGGLTFPVMLVSNTPNDGAATALLPYTTTNSARVKVQARDNIFFDVSDVDFSIAPGPPVYFHSASYSDTVGNANGVIEPGERIDEWAVLWNTSDAAAAGVTAIVSTADAGITMLQATSAYPVIAAGGLGTNAVPFSYQVAKSVPCGTTLTFFVVTIATNGVTTDTLERAVGRFGYGPPQTSTFESVDVPLFIADLTTNISTLVMPATGLVDDIDVTVRIDHAYDGDIQMRLHHPDGTSVMLADQRGGGGQNYGTGDCVSGERTVFDDESATSIAAGWSPYAGSYRPEEPLASFDGRALEGGVATADLRHMGRGSRDLSLLVGSGGVPPAGDRLLGLQQRPADHRRQRDARFAFNDTGPGGRGHRVRPGRRARDHRLRVAIVHGRRIVCRRRRHGQQLPGRVDPGRLVLPLRHDAVGRLLHGGRLDNGRRARPRGLGQRRAQRRLGDAVLPVADRADRRRRRRRRPLSQLGGGRGGHRPDERRLVFPMLGNVANKSSNGWKNPPLGRGHGPRVRDRRQHKPDRELVRAGHQPAAERRVDRSGPWRGSRHELPSRRAERVTAPARPGHSAFSW